MEALKRADGLGDIVELRLDCLQGVELDEALRRLDELLGARARPFILTLRPVEQGGRREIDSLNRLVFWLDRLSTDDMRAEFADIELDLVRVLAEKPELDWNRIICSHHDFTNAKGDLQHLYQQMAATPARILKIAVRADDVTDCIAVMDLIERARREGRELIAVAMGEAGIMTRILGPSRGAFLTYGSLDATRVTATGQPTAEDLRRLYRVHKINEATQIFGLIGSPLAHSVSPHMHNAAFEANDVDAVYIPFEVRDAGDFLRRMVHPRTREILWNLRGLSVTAPHKSAVMEYLDWIEPSALGIGAVNTIVVKDDELHGYNTDAAAFLSSLEGRTGALAGKSVAVIGAGGAALGALWSLEKAGARVTVFSRNTERAAPLASRFGIGCEQLEGASFHNFEVVVNTTPLGTRGTSETETPARAPQLRGARLVYDLIYNPPETLLMREARAAGCEILGGLEMLIAQAAEQFSLWTGKPAPTDAMKTAAHRALNMVSSA